MYLSTPQHGRVYICLWEPLNNICLLLDPKSHKVGIAQLLPAASPNGSPCLG